MLQKERPLFQGPITGSCLTLRNELSKETHQLIKQKILLERHQGGEQQGKGTHENCYATWLRVLGLTVIGFISGLSVANHSDLESFLGCTRCSAKMDAREKDSGRWWDTWCLLLTFPELFRLVVAYLVPCSLLGPPVIKQLMHMVTTLPGEGGWFQSVCFP